LNYREILEAIRTKDPKRFRFTIETNPAYGKYHWTGHRGCGVSMLASESKKLGGRCPVCNKPMTRGVDERVEDLADRPQGPNLDGAIGYMHLLPLHEAIGAVLGVDSLSSPSIWKIFNELITAFGDEYSVLLATPFTALKEVVGPQIAEVILKARNDEITVIPGYDGVYGKIKLFEKGKDLNRHRGEEKVEVQSNLGQFL
jgi:PHP family Zn ribbon phosphoesterase